MYPSRCKRKVVPRAALERAVSRVRTRTDSAQTHDLGREDLSSARLYQYRWNWSVTGSQSVAAAPSNALRYHVGSMQRHVGLGQFCRTRHCDSNYHIGLLA